MKTLDDVLREWFMDPDNGCMLHDVDGVPYWSMIATKDKALAAHLRANGVVMVEDVIGCINKRVMDYAPLGDPIARPMNDVEIQLQLLCDDIRALAAQEGKANPACQSSSTPQYEIVKRRDIDQSEDFYLVMRGERRCFSAWSYERCEQWVDEHIQQPSPTSELPEDHVEFQALQDAGFRAVKKYRDARRKKHPTPDDSLRHSLGEPDLGPCDVCLGRGLVERRGDGMYTCIHCKGTGNTPKDSTDETWIERRNRDPEIKRMFDEEKAKLEAEDNSPRWTVVDRFATSMKVELEANKHKGGWGSSSIRYLLDHLRQEVKELQDVLLDQCVPKWRITAEAADVANFAMMIADKWGTLLEAPAEEEDVPDDNPDWDPVEIQPRTPHTAATALHHRHDGFACTACEITALRAKVAELETDLADTNQQLEDLSTVHLVTVDKLRRYREVYGKIKSMWVMLGSPGGDKYAQALSMIRCKQLDWVLNQYDAIDSEPHPDKEGK